MRALCAREASHLDVVLRVSYVERVAYGLVRALYDAADTFYGIIDEAKGAEDLGGDTP